MNKPIKNECLCLPCSDCNGEGYFFQKGIGYARRGDFVTCGTCEGTGRDGTCEAHSEQMELEPIEGCSCRPGPGFCPTCKAILDAPVYGEKEIAA